MSKRRKITDPERLAKEYRMGTIMSVLARQYDCSVECIRQNLLRVNEPIRPAHRPKQPWFQNWCKSLRTRYPGFGWGRYRRMFQKQRGRCAICRRKIRVKNKKYRSAAVDHNHRTGQIRALLCHGCNLSLGNFRDCPEVCERAAEYLRRYGYANDEWTF